MAVSWPFREVNYGYFAVIYGFSTKNKIQKHKFSLSVNFGVIYICLHCAEYIPYSVHYTVYTQCTLYTVHCTVYICIRGIKYTMYTIQCTSYTVHCTLYSIHYIVHYTLQCIMYTIQCTSYYTLYTVHCTLYTVQCTSRIQVVRQHSLFSLLRNRFGLETNRKLSLVTIASRLSTQGVNYIMLIVQLALLIITY